MVPCNSASMNNGDTPYVYTGGWGDSGDAVDAGYQFSPTNNWLTAFVKEQGQGQMNVMPNVNYVCGQEQLYTFSSGSGQIGLSVGGETSTGGYTGSYIYISVNDLDNWSGTCTGCVVKRMTSIAQASEDLSDGSTFGATAGVQPSIYWSGSYVGIGTIDPCYESMAPYCESRSADWSADWSAYFGGDQDYPDDGTKVLVNQIDDDTEYDGITLHS